MPGASWPGTSTQSDKTRRLVRRSKRSPDTGYESWLLMNGSSIDMTTSDQMANRTALTPYPGWVQFLREHYYFESKSRVTYGPQVALMITPEGVVPGPYVRGLFGVRLNVGSNVIWEGTADTKNGARTTATFGEKFTQGAAFTLGTVAGEWEREVTSTGAIDSYKLVFFGILGGEINSTKREAFIGLMPGASWTLGGGIEGTMKSGFTFKF